MTTIEIVLAVVVAAYLAGSVVTFISLWKGRMELVKGSVEKTPGSEVLHPSLLAALSILVFVVFSLVWPIQKVMLMAKGGKT